MTLTPKLPGDRNVVAAYLGHAIVKSHLLVKSSNFVCQSDFSKGIT